MNQYIALIIVIVALIIISVILGSGWRRLKSMSGIVDSYKDDIKDINEKINDIIKKNKETEKTISRVQEAIKTKISELEGDVSDAINDGTSDDFIETW